MLKIIGLVEKLTKRTFGALMEWISGDLMESPRKVKANSVCKNYQFEKIHFYWTRSLVMLVSDSLPNSLTHSLLFSKLDGLV